MHLSKQELCFTSLEFPPFTIDTVGGKYWLLFHILQDSDVLYCISNKQLKQSSLLLCNRCYVCVCLHHDVNSNNFIGVSAIYLASNYNHGDVVLALLEAGADPDTFTEAKSNPLLIAVAEGHADVVEILLDNNADVFATGVDGITPIMVAVQYKGGNAAIHSRLVKLLLDAGADPDSPNGLGRTLVWIATRTGYPEIIDVLVENGADVDR